MSRGYWSKDKLYPVSSSGQQGAVIFVCDWGQKLIEDSGNSLDTWEDSCSKACGEETQATFTEVKLHHPASYQSC